MSSSEVARQIDTAVTKALWSLNRSGTDCPHCGWPMGDDRFARQVLINAIYQGVNEALDAVQMMVSDPAEAIPAFQFDLQREASLALLNPQRKNT